MAPDRLMKFVHPFNRPNLFYEVRWVARNDSRGPNCWLGSVSRFGGDNPDGRGMELHQWSTSPTGTTIFGDHLLSDSHDV